MLSSMLSKINNYIKYLFSKKSEYYIKETGLINGRPSRSRYDIINSLDYEEYPEPDIVNPEKEKTLFILDDIPDSLTLYKLDFNNIKRKFKKDVYADFKVIKCVGTTAGFKAHKFINIYKNKIDFAILDITLGYIKKLNDGEYLEFDGVDIAIDIIKCNPEARILFSTAHTLNRRNPTMKYYFEKFENYTGLPIENFYLNKNSDRVDTITELLYGS